MQKLVLAGTALLAILANPEATAHPATELYIPIGKSPGISNVKSYLGKIQALRETEGGFSMTVDDGEKTIDVSEQTKIYVDTGKRSPNRIGSEEDCEVGRTVEVYLDDDGMAYWVKVQVP